MSSQFSTGYTSNIMFYSVETLAALIMAAVTNRLPIPAIIGYGLFHIIILCILYRGPKRKKPISEMAHIRLQCIAFIFTHIVLSIAFDSAQTFIYAMILSSVAMFIFLDRRAIKFNMILSLVIIIIVAAFVGYFTGSKQTMFAFTVGTVVLFIMNWIILSMTNMINFQNRKSMEQERSLDDMLRVVEAKCDEARDATRSKTNFLASMSHEIRTPINAVIGMNEIILRESNEESILGYASDAKTAAESLLGIINDILDITKIEAGKLTLNPVECRLGSLINDVYNLIRFKAETKALDFRVVADETLPSVIFCDDIRLKQILINLLTNAVKYTPEGKVTLEIKRVEEGGIFFSVKDTGIGIKEEDLHKLFNAFERIEESRNRSIEGTGLGINITTSLLTKFGSKLEVKSEYGKGSEFFFTIRPKVINSDPLGKMELNSGSHAHSSYAVGYTAPDAHILVVDDNLMNRKVFTNLLKGTKLRISEAASGKEALVKTSETKFDIIFMDHMMPEMDGIQTFDAIRKQDNNPNRDAPVIALTANAIAGAKEFYLDAGFTDFLSKPIDPVKLDSMIYNLLDKRLICPPDDTAPVVTEVKAQLELPIIEGIDWMCARAHLNDDDILLDTIRLFHSAIDRDANELDEYFKDINIEGLLNSYRVKVHSMKSSAGMIGIVQLSGMAMELEKAARNENIAVIKAMHPIFIERWRSYRELLSELVQTDEGDKLNSEEHSAEIEDIIMKIRSAAEEMNVDLLDEMSAELDKYSFPEDKAQKVEEIKGRILNFEIELLMDCSL